MRGRVIGGGGRFRPWGSDRGGNAEPARVLLLGARREGVVEGSELGVHLGGEVVEDPLPGGGLVVATGQQQLPRLGLPVPLAALGEELGEVAVLGRRLLRSR